jgi:hypothetical protein
VGLLVAEATVGKKPETGQTEVWITCRFGPPPESGDAAHLSEEGVFGDHFKNGRESITPGTNVPTLTVVALR